jgi:hypothetical protein
MMVLKSIVAGIACAVAAVVLSIVLLAVGVEAWLRFEMWRLRDGATGGLGAVSAGIAEGHVVLVAALGFVAGFWWEFRRVTGASPAARSRRG